MKLQAHDITHFIFLVAFLLLFARAFGEAARLLRQPGIFGEIIGGVILGPSVFGHLFPSQFHTLFQPSQPVSLALDGLIQLSLILLLLVSGLEVDLGVLVKQGKSTLLTATGSFIFPFIAGFLLAWYFPVLMGNNMGTEIFVFALFIGIAFAITALPVVARTLFDLGIFKSPSGATIISSAMVIDFLGWLIFSVVLGMAGRAGQLEKIPQIIMIVVVFTVGMLIVGRKFFSAVIPAIQTKLSYPGAILNFILIGGLLAASFTEFIGLHAIFGAFIFGVAIADSPKLSEETREIIHQFVANIFAPLFFVSIGLRVDFVQNFNFILLGVFLLFAIVTKVAGSYAGAKLGGFSKADSLLIGFGMNSRGAMEIAIGTVALENKIISNEVFVVLVILAILTSISSSPLMKMMMRRSRSFLTPYYLLTEEQCILTSAENAETVIRELVKLAAPQVNMSSEEIFKQVWAREQDMATGLANGVAVPHARLPISRPFLAAAISPDGIDFQSFDGQRSKLIFLLLTPAGESELQLNMLASIAKFAASKTKIDSITANAENKPVFHELLQYMKEVGGK